MCPNIPGIERTHRVVDCSSMDVNSSHHCACPAVNSLVLPLHNARPAYNIVAFSRLLNCFGFIGLYYLNCLKEGRKFTVPATPP